jgi:hypothetical protein
LRELATKFLSFFFQSGDYFRIVSSTTRLMSAMPDRDHTQINYVFAATALSVGMSLGVLLSHLLWRIDYMHVGSGSDNEASGVALKGDATRLSEKTQATLDVSAFRDKIYTYDALDSVLDASNRMGRLFDKVPDDAFPLAVGLIEDIETRMAKRRAVEVLFTRWSETEPAAAMDAAGAIENRMSREMAQRVVLSVWLKADFAGARQYISRSPDDRGRERLLRHAIAILGDDSPDQAAALVMTSTDPVMKSRRLPKLGNAWGRIDPEAALSWANGQLNEPDTRSQFVADVVHGWALERPVEALQYVRAQTEKDSEDSQELLVEVLRGWASEDPASAVHYILKFDTKEEQLTLMHAIAETLSSAETDAILSWTGAFEGQQREAVLAQLIEYKLADDPVAAAMLARQLPEGDLQAIVFADIMNAWAVRDASGAAEWLKSLAPSAARDSATIVFARNSIVSEPWMALDRAMSISDTQKQAETLTALLESWLLSSPKDAEKWIADHSWDLQR